MANSKNDECKEKHEQEVLQQAIVLSKSKRKLTRDILSWMNGEKIERAKNDRPDIVIRSSTDPNTDVIIGIEHFLVEQVSITNQKDKRISVIKEKQKIIEKLIDVNTDNLSKYQEQEIKDKLCGHIFDIAAHVNMTGIPELKQSFHEVLQKHIYNMQTYRNNLAQIRIKNRCSSG